MTPYHLTPGASQRNAFTAHLSREPSIFLAKPTHRTNCEHAQAVRNLQQVKANKPGPAFNFAMGRMSE